jgi:hypothetical protein
MRPVRRVPTWLSAKPNLKTYQRLITANFDLTRLVLIIPFMLYGIIAAPHYNVADMLEDQMAMIRFIHGANLIFHEAGHIIFMILGQFMMILGGSLNQILIPAGITSYFFFKSQHYSGAITLFWVGENYWDVSIYAKDADEMALPLLGGDGSTHDWNWLLETLNWLPQTQLVGNIIYTIGTLIYLSAIGLAIYFSQKRFAA